MESIAQWLNSIDWSTYGVWALTLTLLVTGLVGAILPLLPGPLILFAAGCIHTWLLPEQGMSITGLLLLGLMLVVAYAVDVFSSAMGAKWFGASRWGIAGVIVGGLVGMFFGLPGLILGPIVGGLVCEVFFAKRDWKSGIKSTWGSMIGTGVGLTLRIVVSVGMVGIVLVDCLW